MKPAAISVVAAAEVVDPQRHQHLDRAEHHRGDRDERGRDQDRAAEDRLDDLAQALALGRPRLGQARGEEGERDRDHRAPS